MWWRVSTVDCLSAKNQFDQGQYWCTNRSGVSFVGWQMTNHLLLLLLRYRQQKSMHRTWSLFGDPKKPKKVYVTNYNIILLPKTAIGSLYNTKARVILSRCVNEYKTKKKTHNPASLSSFVFYRLYSGCGCCSLQKPNERHRWMEGCRDIWRVARAAALPARCILAR